MAHRRTCTVSFTDSYQIRHTIEVGVDTMYEAAALAINAFRKHDCEPGLAAWLDRRSFSLHDMTNALLNFAAMLADAVGVFGDGLRGDEDALPRRPVRLNINADRQLLIEQKRLEQWRGWARDGHLNLAASAKSS